MASDQKTGRDVIVAVAAALICAGGGALLVCIHHYVWGGLCVVASVFYAVSACGSAEKPSWQRRELTTFELACCLAFLLALVVLAAIATIVNLPGIGDVGCNIMTVVISISMGLLGYRKRKPSAN